MKGRHRGIRFFFTVLIFSYNSIYCQNAKIVSLDKKNAFSKKLGLSPMFNKRYYSKNTKYDTILINNGKYEFNIQKFEDCFPRPYRFILEVQKNQSYIYTECFYFENKNKKIIFDSENGKIIDYDEDVKLKKDKLVYETYMKEIISQKKQLDSIKFLSYKNNNFNEIKDSLNILHHNLKSNEQELLLGFSKLHPSSVILLWKIVDCVENEGYDEMYEKAFNRLSINIKNSFPGKQLQKQFTVLKKFTKGYIFNYKIKNTSIKVSKNFTLIDFWFSYCPPCLEEMPKYKELYKKYHTKGFEILGISTDRKNDIGNWKKVIQDKQLVWEQYLDENGTEAKKYNINKFPTTFLLDSEGKIIEKDMSPIELEKFLEKNLK